MDRSAFPVEVAIALILFVCLVIAGRSAPGAAPLSTPAASSAAPLNMVPVAPPAPGGIE